MVSLALSGSIGSEVNFCSTVGGDTTTSDDTQTADGADAENVTIATSQDVGKVDIRMAIESDMTDGGVDERDQLVGQFHVVRVIIQLTVSLGK